MTEGVLPEIAPPGSQVAPFPGTTAQIRGLRADDARTIAEVGRGALIWFGLVVVYGSHRPISQSALIGITFAALVWLAALRSAAISVRLVLGPVVSSGLGTIVGFGIVGVLNQSIVGLHVSFAALVGLALAVLCSVIVWDSFVERTAAAKRRVLLVGTDGLEELLAEELHARRPPRFDILGAVPGSRELADVVEAQRPDIVVLTDESTYDVALDRLLDAHARVRVAGFASFCEYAFGRVPLEQITPAWFMGLVHPRQRLYSRFTKRSFDVVVAVLGLLVSGPVLAALALLNKTTGGSILYRQTRVGEGGRRFTIYKLRTMGCDAEHDGAAFASEHDPRATRIGCVLRRTHLDELPQLWNVLKGDMSIVGPRPERPEFIEMLETAVPFWNRRLLVKPGITGWAQVRSKYASDCESMARKLSYDLWYLRHGSLLVDLAICVVTFFAVLARPLRP